VFTAQEPEGAGAEKYDEAVGAMHPELELLGLGFITDRGTGSDDAGGSSDGWIAGRVC